MNNSRERIFEDLDELKKIYVSLDEANQKRLEEVIIMLKTKYIEKINK